MNSNTDSGDNKTSEDKIRNFVKGLSDEEVTVLWNYLMDYETKSSVK